MAEYFDVDGDDSALERDPVMILSAVPAEPPQAGSHFGRGIDIAAIDGQFGEPDDRLTYDEDTADTDPLGGINPYVDV